MSNAQASLDMRLRPSTWGHKSGQETCWMVQWITQEVACIRIPHAYIDAYIQLKRTKRLADASVIYVYWVARVGIF